jgi:hypothetical protein
VSGLYLLAAPSTPEAARDQVMADAKSGKKLSHDDIKATVTKHKPPKAKAATPKSGTVPKPVPPPGRTKEDGTEERKALYADDETLSARAPPIATSPAGHVKPVHEILEIARRVRARETGWELIDLCDWVIWAAMPMVRGAAPTAPDEPQSKN